MGLPEEQAAREAIWRREERRGMEERRENSVSTREGSLALPTVIGQC